MNSAVKIASYIWLYSCSFGFLNSFIDCNPRCWTLWDCRHNDLFVSTNITVTWGIVIYLGIVPRSITCPAEPSACSSLYSWAFGFLNSFKDCGPRCWTPWNCSTRWSICMRQQEVTWVIVMYLGIVPPNRTCPTQPLIVPQPIITLGTHNGEAGSGVGGNGSRKWNRSSSWVRRKIHIDCSTTDLISSSMYDTFSSLSLYNSEKRIRLRPLLGPGFCSLPWVSRVCARVLAYADKSSWRILKSGELNIWWPNLIGARTKRTDSYCKIDKKCLKSSLMCGLRFAGENNELIERRLNECSKWEIEYDTLIENCSGGSLYMWECKRNRIYTVIL